jgi:hypothetical protein
MRSVGGGMRAAQLQKLTTERRSALTGEDVQQLLRLASPGLRAIIETMVATGVRFGEMLAVSPAGIRALRTELRATTGRAKLRTICFHDFRRFAVTHSKMTGHPLRTFLRKGGK